MLEIKTYNDNERKASAYLSNRAISAFYPASFLIRRYPTVVYEESEIIRYIDTMHDSPDLRFYKSPYYYSQDEAGLISGTADKVCRLTKELFDEELCPIMSPLSAIFLLRAIEALKQDLGVDSISVFEIGPGDGYLGAYLFETNNKYGAVDNTQGFYLWQNRFWSGVAGSQMQELAEFISLENVQLLNKKITHIPWWIYATFYKTCPIKSDIVVCDHALGELSKEALRYVLRVSKKQLCGSRIGLFLYFSPGATQISTEKELVNEFQSAGYHRADLPGVWAFAVESSQYFGGGLQLRNIPKDFGEKLHQTNIAKILSRPRKIQKRIANRMGFGKQEQSTRESWLTYRYFSPSGKTKLMRANDFLSLDPRKYPRDYSFNEFIETRFPKSD